MIPPVWAASTFINLDYGPFLGFFLFLAASTSSLLMVRGRRGGEITACVDTGVHRVHPPMGCSPRVAEEDIM